jgi:PAS domain S-box-containing protein
MSTTFHLRQIRILYLEDSPADVQYVEDLLADDGLDCIITPVGRRRAFEEALTREEYDVIICDFSLPDIDGLTALGIARERAPETPVIIVSGSVDSLTAVNCLRGGATDLLIKDRLERLPSAIRRARDEREHRATLRELESRFQQMASQVPTAFWFIAPDPEQVLYVNPAAEALWGMSAEQLMREPRAFLRNIHAEERERVDAAWAAFVRGEDCEFGEEFRVAGSDGAVRWLHHTATRLLDDTGVVTRLCAMTHEITQRKVMESRMQHAQRLEVVGRLTGGIAHDFNTLLTVVTTTSELLLTRLDSDDPAIADLAEIRSAGERGAALVAQLMAFSRQQILRPRVIDAVDLLQGLERMVLRLLGANIRFVLNLPPVTVPVRVDPSQIEQVLLNLVVNARDAMRHGGTLTVTLESIIPEDGDIVRKFGADDPVVQISVTDTGIGMSDEVQRRVFEPFYTTKNAEGGTGLGLATVYGIVEQSGGLVRLTSAPGEGTTFRVLLPLAAGAELTRSSVVDRAPHRGSGTVLVVDDDQSLRYLVRRTLGSVGYTVLMAEDGNAALRLIEEHQGAIQLLLTDLVMPEMSGHELARRSREVNPGLRVLYMSGYTEDEAMRQSIQSDGTAFVAKPFSVSSLTRGVSRALGLGD